MRSRCVWQVLIALIGATSVGFVSVGAVERAEVVADEVEAKRLAAELKEARKETSRLEDRVEALTVTRELVEGRRSAPPGTPSRDCGNSATGGSQERNVAAAKPKAGAAGGFLRDWLVSGPWPNVQLNDASQGLDTDFLKPEETALPYAGLAARSTFVADWNKLVAGIGAVNEWGFATNATFDATWREWHSERDLVTFPEKTFAPIADYYVVYAACYVTSPRAQDVLVLCGSDDDHKVWLDDAVLGRGESNQGAIPGSFAYPARLPKGTSRLLFKLQERLGGAAFCLQLTDRAGEPLTDVSFSLDARGRPTTLADKLAREQTPDALARRKDVAQRAIAAATDALRQERVHQEALTASGDAAKKALDAAYADYERRCADGHAASAAKAPRGVDEPLAPATRRSVLCLNGSWEMRNKKGKWTKGHLPSQPIEGRCYRTHFSWDGRDDVVFRCDGIWALFCAFRVNGQGVGTVRAHSDVVRMPLRNLKVGDNVLEIDLEPDTAVPKAVAQNRGVRGDLFLEYVPKVCVEDVWIKTSWRTCELRVTAQVTGAAAGRYDVRCYAVRDGRIRCRLPARQVELASGESASVTLSGGWGDAETWGIGGRFGEPNLYTLVTDVLADGKLVDRHEETFGFREFWIHQTDFYLNGKRIFLQGDVGHLDFEDKRNRDVMWPRYRADGINIVRGVLGVAAMRDADRMGMAVYAQTSPILSERGDKPTVTNYSPFAAWQATPEHRRNLVHYENWWKRNRNHPSVLIWSTDNEILTQAWDTEPKADYNVRNDRIGALYGQFVKSLDPDLVMTRDGDVGTWNRQARWFEDPPCDTANYHYPDFNVDKQVRNWRKTYEWRPVVFGETLYCSYGAFDQNVGAIPDKVARKARKVRDVAGLYRRLGVPAPIFMGLGSDGFVQRDDTGKGNPFGLTEREHAAYAKDGTLPKGMGPRDYPWMEIAWPSESGRGLRPFASRLSFWFYTCELINAYNPRFPAVTRNAVAKAYRDLLLPQPPLRSGTDAEVIVAGAAPGEDVWATCPDGSVLGMRADADGKAWFREIDPGDYVFTFGGREVRATLAPRGDAALKPGFGGLREVR